LRDALSEDLLERIAREESAFFGTGPGDIYSDRGAMREMHRVLSTGGWAVILVPSKSNQETTFEDPSVVSPDERTRLFDQADHVRRYGMDIKNRLEETGFAVKREDYTKELSEETIKRHGLKPRHGGYIYLCIKPQKTPESL
jgi:hypothetical protein